MVSLRSPRSAKYFISEEEADYSLEDEDSTLDDDHTNMAWSTTITSSLSPAQVEVSVTEAITGKARQKPATEPTRTSTGVAEVETADDEKEELVPNTTEEPRELVDFTTQVANDDTTKGDKGEPGETGDKGPKGDPVS